MAGSTLEFLIETGRAKANLDELQKTMQQTRDKALNTDAMKAATLQQVAADKDHVKVLGDKLTATKNLKAAAQEALTTDKQALEVLGKAKLAQENYGRAVKESFNALKQQSLVLKDLTAVEQKYADTLDKVNKAELSLNDAAKRMNESATAIYQQRQKMLSQAGSYSKMTKEQKKEYDDLTKAQQAALNSMDDFADAQARMQMELRDSGAKMTAYAQGIGQVGANFGSMMGAFGEFGKVPGLVATQVGQMVGQFDKLGEMQGPEKMMASMNLALAGAQMLMQIVGSIDEGIRKAEQAVIDTGKGATSQNLDIENFNLTNKSLTDRIELVNKLAESNPQMAASLRGVIGSEKEFAKATQDAQKELKELRAAGLGMEWKSEQTGGGLVGWLKSVGTSINDTAKNMGSFLASMEDFRNGTSTAMAKGQESLTQYASSTDGWKSRIIQMDIQIAEKQGDINKSHELQLNLIRQEGANLEKNLQTTILILKSQQEQNRVTQGGISVDFAKQSSILAAEIAKIPNYSKDIWKFINTAVQDTKTAASAIFEKTGSASSKAWEAIWDKFKKDAKNMTVEQQNAMRTLLQGGALDAAAKAYVEMARGAKEAVSGNTGLAAIIKQMEESLKEIPGYTQEIVDRQKTLWSLEKDGAKVDKERLETKKETVKVVSQLVDNEKDYTNAIKEAADIDKAALDRRMAALKKQQEYYDSQKSILDIIAGKQAELDKLNGVGSTTPQAQIEAIGKAAGMSKEAIQGFIDKYNEIGNSIDEVTKKINEAKQAEKEYNDEVNKTKGIVDNILKSWEKQAEDNRVKRMGEQMAENLFAPLKNIKVIEGVTDGLIDNLKKQINQVAIDTAKQLNSLNKEFSDNQNAMKTANAEQLETLKRRNEEIKKEIQDTLAMEKTKRAEIVKEYADGISKTLQNEQTKLDKMLDDYNKRLLDREKQTQDAKLKLGDYVYRQTHTAEENAVRDAVSGYQKEYEEFRKAGVAKEDLAQWQALKQKELTKDFTAQQKAAFEAQKKAAIDASEAIVKAAQEAWDKETKKQRDEINTQIDLVNQLRQAALDAKNILLELLGQPVDNRQAAVTPRLGEPVTGGQSTSGKEPPLSYGAGLHVGGNVTWNGIVWRWNGKGWDYVKTSVSGNKTVEGDFGSKYGDLRPPGATQNDVIKGVVDSAIGITKDGAVQTAIGNAFGNLGLGQIAGKSFVDTFKDMLVGKEGNGGLAGEAPGYGKTIVEMLAKGISDNAHLLREAVDKLTLEISLQLEPHSPPKEGRLHTIDKWMPKIVGLLTKGVLTDSDIRKPFYMLADKIASSLGVGLDYGVIQAARQFKSSYSKNMTPLIQSIESPKTGVFGTEWQNKPTLDYTAWNKQKKQLLEYQAFEASLSMRPGANWTDFEAGGKYADTEMAKIFSKNRDFDVQNGTDGKIGLGTNMAKGLLESSWFKALTPKLTDRQILETYGQFGKQNMGNYNAFAGYDTNELFTMLPYLKNQDTGNDSYWQLLNRVYYNMRELPNEAGYGGHSLNERFENVNKNLGVNFRDMLTTKFAQQFQIKNPEDAMYGYRLWKEGQESTTAIQNSSAKSLSNRPAAIDSGYAQGYDDWARANSYSGKWAATNFESYDSYARRVKTYPGDSAYIKLAKDRAGYIDNPSSTNGVSDLAAGVGSGVQNTYYVSINIYGDNLDSESIAQKVIDKLGESGDIYA